MGLRLDYERAEGLRIYVGVVPGGIAWPMRVASSAILAIAMKLAFTAGSEVSICPK